MTDLTSAGTPPTAPRPDEDGARPVLPAVNRTGLGARPRRTASPVPARGPAADPLPDGTTGHWGGNVSAAPSAARVPMAGAPAVPGVRGHAPDLSPWHAAPTARRTSLSGGTRQGSAPRSRLSDEPTAPHAAAPAAAPRADLRGAHRTAPALRCAGDSAPMEAVTA